MPPEQFCGKTLQTVAANFERLSGIARGYLNPSDPRLPNESQKIGVSLVSIAQKVEF
jgi:hypothetical protein